MAQTEPRHILSLSGGKDSTALAIYMRDRVRGMEYVFCDTEKELPETYEYLDKLEAYLNQPIVRLRKGGKGFDDLLAARNGFLPSSQMRWCTQYMKIEPFEDYVGDALAFTYIGIRADENRAGYISTKPNLTPVYPFKEDGIDKAAVARILEESGLGFPDYYRWRSRSGCYFCFYQQRQEWVGLLENHPELYKLAEQYEKMDHATGERYTWSQRESLEELRRPERIEEIKAEAARRQAQPTTKLRLVDMFAEDDDTGCLICHL